MTEEMMEYTVFTVTARDGKEVEMAVIDEFELDGIAYIVSSVVIGDTISDDGMYIYRAGGSKEEFEAVKITSEEEYTRAAEYYLSLE